MKKPSLNYRNDLQGLRGLAIALVCLAHAEIPYFSGGYIGVDVFFVLSGYLITGILLKELQQDNQVNFAAFYARRLKRLLPALIVMLVVIFVISILLLSGVEARAQNASSVFAATWTSNLFFTFLEIDYFDELSGRDLFLHTWSLGVEEQFYLIWPIVLLFFFSLHRAINKLSVSHEKILLLCFTLAIILSLALSIYWMSVFPQGAFYLMPSRIWQFAIGGLVFILTAEKEETSVNRISIGSTWLTKSSLFLGLAMVSGSALLLDKQQAYPGFWAIIPSLGTALIIAAGSINATPSTSPLTQYPLVWLGDRSYSLYLWHWPIFTMGNSLTMPDTPLTIAGMFFTAFLIAALSYRFVERPFWKGSLGRFSPKRILFCTLFVMSVAIFFLFSGLKQLPKPGSEEDIAHAWRMDKPVIYGMGCDSWYYDSKVNLCVWQNPEAPKTALLLGDSIMAQWFSMLPEIFASQEWRIAILTKSSCAMVDEDWYYKRIGMIYDVCTTWRNHVLDELENIRPDVLFVGSALTYDFSEKQWREGSTRIFNRLSKMANHVFVVPGTPSLGFDGPGCLARSTQAMIHLSNENCVGKNRGGYADQVKKQLQIVADRFENVYLLDLNDLVCPAGDCYAITHEGTVVFRDGHHITDTFVRSISPHILKQLTSINANLSLPE